jgi:long-chain acyl-CoA synthetase
MAFPTFGAVLARHGRERSDHPALVFEGTTMSFAALDRMAWQVYRALRAAGLGGGGRIAYLGKNSAAYFALLFGAARAGAVIVPVNWRLAPAEIAYIVADAEAPILFVGEEFTVVAQEQRGSLWPPGLLVSLVPTPGFTDLATWLAPHSAGPDAAAENPDDPVVQLYTSGTTGRPKGVMLTHRNFFAPRLDCAAAGVAWDAWRPDDVSLDAMPVGHIGGTNWGVMALYNGCTTVLLREFEPARALEAIERFRINKMFLVPAALQLLLRQPRVREIDYSRVRHIFYGASPIPLDLLREAVEVFGCGFAQQYGMTETCGTIVALEPEDHDPRGTPRMRAAGKALPGVEIAVVDETGKPLPQGAVGEVVIRSAANMPGYWKLPEATARTIDAQGWLHTGDAGYMDADGYLYIHDRIKDMIVSGAENVYPAEVESAIYGHPDVADAAVIGVPDATWGEAVRAVVVPKPGCKPDPADIIAFARTRIAGFKLPKAIDFVDALPRNASGKLLRRELREPHWVGYERRVN